MRIKIFGLKQTQSQEMKSYHLCCLSFFLNRNKILKDLKTTRFKVISPVASKGRTF